MENIKEKLYTLQKHAMMGISYMGPVFTIAALSKILAGECTKIGLLQISVYLNQLASMVYLFIIPIFSMFTSYSIADKPGIVPGFIAGWIAINGLGNSAGSGVLGVLVFTFITGYFVKFVSQKIKFKDLYNSIVPTFLVPLAATIFLPAVYLMFIGPVFAPVHNYIIELIRESGSTGQIIYAIITAAAISYDLGGPVNKTAILFSTLLAAVHVLPVTAINLAIVIPPVGIGLSTVIDRLFKKGGVYDDDMREMGKDSYKLGLIAISEGGLPFLYEKPKESLVVNITGSIIGAVIAVSLGAVQWYPISAIWGWFFVKNVPAYILGLAAGVLITAIGNVLIRMKD